jgi:hypothetical protein
MVPRLPGGATAQWTFKEAESFVFDDVVEEDSVRVAQDFMEQTKENPTRTRKRRRVLSSVLQPFYGYTHEHVINFEEPGRPAVIVVQDDEYEMAAAMYEENRARLDREAQQQQEAQQRQALVEVDDSEAPTLPWPPEEEDAMAQQRQDTHP